MPRTQLLIATLFLALLTVAGIGYLVTAHLPAWTASGRGQTPRELQQVSMDRMEFETAGQLASMADTDGEQHLARQAMRLTDQILDQSLQTAMASAEQDMQSSGAEGRAFIARIRQSEQTLEREKDQQVRLEATLSHASAGRKAALQEQLAMLNAQMQLEQAQLKDARADALRSGTTDLGLLQQIAQEHQANHDPTPANHAGESTFAPGITIPVRGLADATSTLYRLYHKQEALDAAQNQTAAEIQRLLQQHAALDDQLQREEQNEKQAPAQIRHLLASGHSAEQRQGRGLAAQKIGLMHRLAAEQTQLTGFDQQVQLERELADIYNRWQLVTNRQQKQTLHVLFRELLLLMLLLGGLAAFDGGMEHLFRRLHREEKRISTLRRLTRVGVILIGIIGTLMIAFGRPQQLVTILGLAGAGLTVAFEDALLSIAGWFLLMGRNGIAVGDWVEINDVVGEVIEVGLFRTVLLETGNWTEPGHPTGRKVFCPNTFAFRSAYFNFTSARKWLWDEIQIALPSDLDPRHVSEELTQVAQKETGVDAEAAALDYRGATRLRALHAVPTAPVVQLRPGSSGLLICIRYVTTAQKRVETRERLYQATLAGFDRERNRAMAATARDPKTP